eukprot:GHRR01016664.1.p1 GENE.GHRR01016664.1~~GHRR01016664.1.p1  ORF type:complete len:521 (+),score=205.06 GHRR01016664.1:133-1695(+)
MAEADVLSTAAAPEPVDIEFHGVLYTITISTRGDELLVVDLEDKDTFDRWRGEFGAKYVEDITSKTGNFKKFAVFVRMLQSAVTHQSDSVFVDLLTYQDLELLKSKKAANGIGAAAPPRQLPVSNKRYLILTYASEFDRVHYPLPLLEEEQPDPQRLKSVIKQLKQQLDDMQAGHQLQHSRQQQQQSSIRQRSGGASQASVDADSSVLASRLEVVQAELQQERAEHKRELRRKARQIQELQDELSRSHAAARDLRLHMKDLQQQLDDARRSGAAAAAAAAAATARQAGGAYRRTGTGTAGDRGQHRGLYTSGGSSGYLAGKYPSRPSRQHSSGTTYSRGSSPASSRATSPGYNRPWASGLTPPQPPRPGSAPPKQRFDPTEYIRQKREREQQMIGAGWGGGSGSGSRASSRGNSPARSRQQSLIGGTEAAAAAGGLGPRSSSPRRGLTSPGVSYNNRAAGTAVDASRRAGSAERRSCSGDASRRSPGYLRHTLSNGSGRSSYDSGIGAPSAAGRLGDSTC